MPETSWSTGPKAFGLALLFLLVVTPVALVRRLLGRDALGLRFERGRASYWVDRPPGSLSPDSFRRPY